MNSEPSAALRPIIIIKRKKVVKADGHHGGAWKVAYADFVTAMMAFFLLMWLLNATSEDQRKGLADYFNPQLPISRTSAGGAGMLSGDTIFSKEIESASKPEGVPPNPTHRPEGPTLGDETASPDLPPGDDPTEALAAGPHAAGLNPERATRAEAEAAEQARLAEIERKLREAMERTDGNSLDRHFLLRVTPEGLVIEIIDADDSPLFASASAQPAPILPLLMDVLVPVLDQTTNPIAIVGHTDSIPFDRDGYSNWELSADRANAARRLMVGRGLPERRVARISGRAAVEPLTRDPTAPQNRRIAITLLRNASKSSQ